MKGKKYKAREIVALLTICILTFTCSDDQVNNIYNFPVNLKFDLLDERDKVLSGANGYKEFVAQRLETDRLGLGGILVYNTGVELRAYDLACPVERQGDVRVKPNSKLQVVCPKCGAVFSMETGNAQSGSKTGLQNYHVIGESPYVHRVMR